MSVTGRCVDGARRTYVKGAPDLLLPLCTRILTPNGESPLTESHRRAVLAQNTELASEALRVLGFAYRNGSGDERALTFVGLAGLADPPRREAFGAIAACHSAGIRVVMITGDHEATARAVAGQLSILRPDDRVLTGRELDAMDDAALLSACRNTSVFARVTPEHKLRIVRAYKDAGEIVAMTGDGVNDAPALKEADIGVAMGKTGTDVTREAAQVILLDDNFATLVAAVEEGRTIYQNIRHFLRYLLACNTGEVLTMFGGMLIGMPVILTPIQLLLVNLVTDGLPAIALGMEPGDGSAMHRPPRDPGESVFSDGLLGRIVFRGILIGLATLLTFSLLLGQGASLAAARTGALVALVATQLFHVLECRSETRSLLELNPFGNPLLLAAAAISAAAVALAVYFPPLQSVFATEALSAPQLRLSLAAGAAAPVCSIAAMAFSHAARGFSHEKKTTGGYSGRLSGTMKENF
jgi:Ca2+-transporting ATPase